MHSTQALWLLALASSATATTYATFYTDSACSQDPTDVNFSVDNPGCFAVGGREYVKYHGTNAQCFSLIKSPQPGCNCQFDCVEGASSADSPVDTCGPIIIPDSDCHYIGQSQSLRYIGGTCPANTCSESRRDLSSSSLEWNNTVAADFVGYFDETPAKRDAVVAAAQSSAVEKKQAVSRQRRSRIMKPRDNGEPGLGYYQLCQDEYCTKGCSVDFRTTNPGCFAGNNYKSLNIAGGLSGYRFVASPSASCPCQNACNAIDTSLGCTVLPDDITNAVSLRMVGGEKCDPNNC